MHYLANLIKEIDKTHPHLGNLTAMCMLAIKAKKLLLVVAPRGTGKSRISSFVGLSVPDACIQDRISVAGLGYLKEEFNDFKSVVIVDDIAKTQTPYARIATITTIAELVYSHYCKSALSGMFYSIENFNGSAIVNVQPVLLKELVKSDEWEASIQDKSIRYYHLYRPQKPNPAPPSVKLEWGIELEEVSQCRLSGKLAKDLHEIAMIQWGSSRCIEHLVSLARSAAALDNRKEVNTSDLLLLSKVLQPLRYEGFVTSKSSFESDRNLNSNMLAILTEYVTYGDFTLTQLAEDYKLSMPQCYRIMRNFSTMWVEVSKSPTVYSPSKELKVELKKMGLLKPSRGLKDVNVITNVIPAKD